MRLALIAVVILVGCSEKVAQPLPSAPTPFVAPTPNPPLIRPSPLLLIYPRIRPR